MQQAYVDTDSGQGIIYIIVYDHGSVAHICLESVVIWLPDVAVGVILRSTAGT